MSKKEVIVCDRCNHIILPSDPDLDYLKLYICRPLEGWIDDDGAWHGPASSHLCSKCKLGFMEFMKSHAKI